MLQVDSGIADSRAAVVAPRLVISSQLDCEARVESYPCVVGASQADSEVLEQDEVVCQWSEDRRDRSVGSRTQAHNFVAECEATAGHVINGRER
eukprot:3209336-Rhodomonas_salina.1